MTAEGALLPRDRQCSDCPTPIKGRGKTGRCRPCAARASNSDPAFQANRIRALRASELLKRGSPIRLRAGKLAAATRWADPEYAESARKWFIEKVRPHSTTPEKLAARDDAARGRKVSETRMAWCPAEHRNEYRALIRAGFHKAEAQPMILEMIRAKARRERRRMSPFERQDAALAKQMRRAA